jgi:hypothetical protein
VSYLRLATPKVAGWSGGSLSGAVFFRSATSARLNRITNRTAIAMATTVRLAFGLPAIMSTTRMRPSASAS